MTMTREEEALYDLFCAMDNQDTPLEEWPARAIAALSAQEPAKVSRESLVLAADKAKLLALAQKWDDISAVEYRKRSGGNYFEGKSDAYDEAADELRAVVEELENGDGTQ